MEKLFSNKKSIVWCFILAFLLIALDQYTKLYFKGFSLFGIEHHGVGYGTQIPVIGTILQWTYIENAGMAFGIQFGWGKIFLSLFSIIAGTFLAYLIFKLKDFSFWIKLGFSFIFAGAVGNLIDRVFYGVFFHEGPLFYGRVVDFIQVDIPDIKFLGWSYFPIFNIADSCVTVGVIILILFHQKLPEFHQIFPKKQKTEVNLDSPHMPNNVDIESVNTSQVRNTND
jgi:signal peptidase II